ncbi:MAG: copper oxidase, partial [Nitrospinaceae bacterium]
MVVWTLLVLGSMQIPGGWVSQADAAGTGRTIVADVVAFDLVYFYNRFGSFNPTGMMYALKRDVNCHSATGADLGPLANNPTCPPGMVHLRDGKRPRPLVLRANKGDTVVVNFTNMLDPVRPLDGGEGDSTATRDASIVVSHLESIPAPGTTNHDPKNTGLAGISPGDSFTYRWKAEFEGMHIFESYSAPAGGEGDGGQQVLGLYGALIVEPEGSDLYRSQVTEEELALANSNPNYIPGDPNSELPILVSGVPGSGYEVTYPASMYPVTHPRYGDPVLNLLKPTGNPNEFRLVHGDLNAIIYNPTLDPASDGERADIQTFREFGVLFQGELKTVHPPALDLLNTRDELAGVRDGFGINYGASGLGAPMLTNRAGAGPAANCVECSYEEFFLESWPNGDPALLHQYREDPSNVHHSYLGDNVRFRNTHIGPKETHVFHLHAHQWVSQTADGNGTYLDSQTIAPQQAFNYDIWHGGSGNRNSTPGDSIFHCHLYPHFAQGMWELWRSHDVFEDGSRRLPDGLEGPGTDPYTGITAGGTPVPAIVPVPGLAMPPMPTYGGTELAPTGFPGYPFYIAGVAGHRPPQAPLDIHEDAGLPRHVILGGVRDEAHSLVTSDFHNHIVAAEIKILPQDGTPLEKQAMAFHAKGSDNPADTSLTNHSHATKTPDGAVALFKVNGLPPAPGAPFADPCPPLGAVGTPWWSENAWDDPALYPNMTTAMRDYHVSAIQLDLLVSAAGWHDPQARINVLDSDVDQFLGPGPQTADPFFFRVNSGECVRFYHTNRTPAETELDDFQVITPTDTIGQHIHLVKFDVTASDGSGNGWNYEDGTFARDAVIERIHAANNAAQGGAAVDIYGAPVALSVPAGEVYQTTTQRWWADPLINVHKGGADRTIRTVFTHDHFAPSTIQQHGFYSALVVEPEGSAWLNPQG